MTPCELWLDACVLHQQTTFLSSQASNLLNFIAMAPRCSPESGHLLHSALTCPSSADPWRLKSRHPFVPAAQQLISSSDNNIHTAQWADHQWNVEWLDNTTWIRIFIPDTDTGTLPPGMTFPRRAWCRLNRLRTGVGFSAPACTNGVWSPLRPVSVAQKNKPSTMLSSYVQSINLPMDCMAWQFWTMRQPNGCSTPAPRSSAAKQWFKQLAQKKKNPWCGKSGGGLHLHSLTFN